MSDSELAQLLYHHLKVSRNGDKAQFSRLQLIVSEAMQLQNLDLPCHVCSECSGDCVQEGCEQQSAIRPVGPLGATVEAVKGEPSCNLSSGVLGKDTGDVSSIVLTSSVQNIGESSRQQREQLDELLRRVGTQQDVDTDMTVGGQGAPIVSDDVDVMQSGSSEVQSASVQSFTDGLPQRQPVYQRTSFD